jgi:hypothetical protein
MVGGRSGMAVNCQLRSLAARTVAVPSPSMTKRRSVAPRLAAGCAVVSGSASPPVVATLRLTCPLARMTSTLPAGTAIGPLAACTGSPGRRPCRISGGFAV